ncbi:hypothetical protein ACFPA8_23395 [Streptomyces ovatisporus]|uniref:Uncharacterized protein n=1 Tax=Streptomyces ovatisporus TaxID=1128682 RepID=A0ABV9AB53_9ACTN
MEADDLDAGVTVLLAPGEELSGQGSFARIARARASAPDAEQALARVRENAAVLSFLFRVTSPEPGTV